ncbi:hypothetical protein FRC08_001337, partial [Ceratobasidium sp. 394]
LQQCLEKVGDQLQIFGLTENLAPNSAGGTVQWDSLVVLTKLFNDILNALCFEPQQMGTHSLQDEEYPADGSFPEADMLYKDLLTTVATNMKNPSL